LDRQMKPQVKLQAQVIVWLRLDFDYTLVCNLRFRGKKYSAWQMRGGLGVTNF
jgi:hypothetical protein